MQNNTTYTAGLYLRLSKDDEQAGESVSIGTQRAILLDFCQQEGYAIHDIYIDDGVRARQKQPIWAQLKSPI